ncbi:MAG: sigma-70 family RNA polymerase sigma factor [Xanthomonadales bacterium]|nr:sigma-70 family RNA polymerase sigma factor [Xanthomonadales bacterium]
MSLLALSPPPVVLTSTTQLLSRYRLGDLAARDRLVERYLPILQRWAHGRLPRHRRDLADTEDLVQLTFLRALHRFDAFEAERPGAFLAYLRTILLNTVREELRRPRAGGDPAALDTAADPGASVVEQLVGAQTLQAYEQALAQLPQHKRLAVILRVEFGLSHEQVALELELPSANAARMTVARALEALARLMPE